VNTGESVKCDLCSYEKDEDSNLLCGDCLKMIQRVKGSVERMEIEKKKKEEEKPKLTHTYYGY